MYANSENIFIKTKTYTNIHKHTSPPKALNALNPDNAALRALALDMPSAKREEAELRRAFDEAEAQADKIYEELSPSGDDEVTLVNNLFNALLMHYADGRYRIAGHLIRRA